LANPTHLGLPSQIAEASTNQPGADPRRGPGFTVRELARVLRVSPDRIRSWIKSGQLGAINTASVHCGKPRFVVLPHHLAEFEHSRRVARPSGPVRKKKRTGGVDYYP
jgi:hypothetical protein